MITQTYVNTLTVYVQNPNSAKKSRPKVLHSDVKDWHNQSLDLNSLCPLKMKSLYYYHLKTAFCIYSRILKLLLSSESYKCKRNSKMCLHVCSNLT